MKIVATVLAWTLCSITHQSTDAFINTPTSVMRSNGLKKMHQNSHSHYQHTNSKKNENNNNPPQCLRMSYNDNPNRNDFNLSKPTFDLFTLRSIRNDALLQYSSLNQSEPLRINIYLILTITLLSFPTLSEAVIGEEATFLTTIASTVSGIGSALLFVKECQSRSKQLDRMEKELNAEFLTLKLSTANAFETQLYGRNQPTVSLKDLRGKKRLFILSGPSSALRDVAISLRVFRRRLAQASSVVVLVPTDDDYDDDDDDTNVSNVSKKDGVTTKIWNMLGMTEGEIRSCQWLAEPQDVQAWVEYCTSLRMSSSSDSTSSSTTTNTSSTGLIWFGLNYNGRSFASGTYSPRLLELLGRNLRPVDILDEDDANEVRVISSTIEDETQELLTRQGEFYQALTNGNLEAMKSIFYSQDGVQEVTDVINVGGRIDKWESCLQDGARPSGMKISGSDVTITSPTTAYSTTIEFPPNTGGYGDSDATLLAVQQWRRSSQEGEWKLEYHQTIPWNMDTRAGGTLRCDCRGCVALTRGQERRTFGGLIG